MVFFARSRWCVAFMIWVLAAALPVNQRDAKATGGQMLDAVSTLPSMIMRSERGEAPCSSCSEETLPVPERPDASSQLPRNVASSAAGSLIDHQTRGADGSATGVGNAYRERVRDGQVFAGNFDSGFAGCLGVYQCQFITLAAAQAFCDQFQNCTGVTEYPAVVNGDGCTGGFGCFSPRRDALIYSDKWLLSGGVVFEKVSSSSLESEPAPQTNLDPDMNALDTEGETAAEGAQESDDTVKPEAVSAAVAAAVDQIRSQFAQGVGAVSPEAVKNVTDAAAMLATGAEANANTNASGSASKSAGKEGGDAGENVGAKIMTNSGKQQVVGMNFNLGL